LESANNAPINQLFKNQYEFYALYGNQETNTESSKVCDHKNEFCVCDKMGFPPYYFSECRRDANNAVVIVGDSCYRKRDNIGNEICHLNGCGDILIGLDENSLAQELILSNVLIKLI
jgi:hypothetical protein